MKTFLLILIKIFMSVNLLFSQANFWGEQNSGVTAQLTSVSAVDNNVVWIYGYNGIVLRTTISGLSWLNVSSGIPNTVSLIVDRDLTPVSYRVTWVARELSSGVYFYSLFTSSFVETKKMVLGK